MISKLRIKLILAAMVSLLMVLTIISGAIAILNYGKIVSDADATLNLLAENGGYFPDVQPDDFSELQDQSLRLRRPSSRREPMLPPELPFETRYFFAVLDAQGQVSSVDTRKIAAIDDLDATQYAETVVQQGKERGFWGSYRYLVSSTGEETLVIFLDCGRKLDSFQTLLLSSLFVSAVGASLVLLLLVLLSGRIVKPFLENYEKEKRFITDAGHELKTPLTIIDADTEILAMDWGENEWISDIQAQTRRLSDLTNDLILLSRMEEPGKALPMMEFPLSDVVEESIQSFQTLAKAQGKALSVHIEPMLSLCGDEKSIRKLVSILLDNALKYSPSGAEIRCELERKKNSIQFAVENPTDQMPRAQTQRLFDRFYRTDRSRNSQTGGYGLGLSIAQAIVHSHRGKIAASTRDEHSLTITVYLPL